MRHKARFQVLTVLEAYPADYIESNYAFFKLGYMEVLKRRAQSQ